MKQIVLLLACLVSVHATVPLLKLFFNASFYAETSNHSEIQLPLNASPSVLYEHYEREILINCTAPNELFQLHRDFFMYGPDKTCQIQSWLKAPSIIAHESKGLIDKYVRFIYHNKSTEQRGFIDQVMEEYAMVSAEDVECFFNCNPLLDFTVSSLWAANLKHIPLKLDTFAFLWQDYLESPEDFLASIVEAKIPSHFATYAAAHVKSGDSVPVAEYFCSFLTQHGSSISPRAIEDYSLQFFHALLNNHKAQLGILNSFEGVVSNRTNVRSYPQTLLLLAESTRRGDFLPSTIRCLLHFRNKVTARDGNSTVYVDALSVAVRAYSAKPELSAEFLSLFEETVHLLAQDVLFFDWNVIHAVLHHLEAAHTTYAQRVAELDDLQGAIAQFSTVANCTIPLLRTIAERYPLLPQKTANKVLALSMHLLKFSKSKDFDLKALLVVFSRLRTQGVSLPTALLSTVAPVLLQLSPRHVTVERAALKALATLSSESLQVPLEVLEKLPAVARRINETGVFQSAISILRSYADKLSAPTLQALVEMEKAQGIALARARSELNTGNFFASLDDATRSYLLGANATVQEAFESHFELMISRMDWTLDEAVSLANHCNASTVDTFLHALRYITSYNVSASLLSDMGYHVLDIVSGANSDDMKRCGSCVPDQQAALSWREAIKSMSEQHTLFPSLSASDLLKGVTMSNRTCLSYASESAGGLCVVDVSLSTNVSLWVRSQLQLVGDLEGRGALQLVYAAKAGENRSAAVQFYLSGDARQLVAEHLASKTVVVVKASSVNLEGIPNALHQRIAAELSAPNPDVEFAFTAEEERAIFTYLDAATGVPSARKLSAWQEADYLAWAQNLRAADRDAIDISEVIAVCKAAMFHTLGLRPRDSQVISLLLLLEDGASAGRLLQISTGEGKSLIVAMFAAFQVLVNRETVDIMTSAPVLAVRDWTEYQYFFGNLSITSAHNTDNPDSTTFTKKCYEAEVVYGDMLHFIGDYLGDISHNVKMGRGFGVAIVDEVDNMFIDEISKKVQKASRVPGLEHLRKALVYMWLFQNTVLPNIQFVEPNSPRARIVEPVVDEVTRQIIGYKVVAEDINGIEFLSDLSYNFTLYKVLGELTLDENKTIVIPKYLDALAKDQLRPWVQSSIYARFFQAVNVTFVITNQSFIGDSQLRIVPVELDTGVLQFNMNIDDGVTQFLQIQNGLAMTSESLTSEFFSYPSYFLKYKGKLFGMTGTIGKDYDKQFLHQTYGVDFATVPLHKQKNVAHFPPQVTVNNTAQWLRNIERAVHEVAVQDNRAVLVVAQSIKAMRTISAYLISMGHAVRAYGDTDTLDDPTVVRRWLMTREVIVGTNLAGRGTDLKFTDRVKWNGGLHVIVSFHTTGDRTEKQNFGRVARAGDPGTTQLIINLPSYEFGKETNNDLLIEGLAITRDVEEKERMLVNALCQVPMVKLQDELFEEQVDLIHAVDSPTKLQFIVRKTECVKVNSPDACVFPAGKGGIKVKLNDRSGKTSVVDLTVKLSVVEPIAFKHILSVLHAPEGSGSKLSKTDFEVLNFLLAKVGFGAESEEVSKRVANAYTLAVTTSTTQPTVAGLAIYKRYHEDWLSWFNTGKEIIMQYLLTTVSIADEKVSEMSKEEIGLLEKTFLDADENYDGSDLTEKRLSDGKLKLMYKYWREDRALYTYEFELLQLQDDWALWLKKQTSLYMQNSTCRDVVIDGFSPGSTAVQISEAKKTLATNYAALRKRLFDNFAVFRLDGQRRVFWNPAYVIRKALDMERISNSQVFLGKVLKALKATAWLTNKIYVKNPLDTALSLLRDAVAMDEKSWVPHNALGLVYLTKESPTITHVDQSADAGRVMRQFADHIVDARNLINDVSIPQLQHQLVNLVSFNVTGVASELSIQLLYSIKILQLVSSTMDTNLETLQSAADAGKMVRVSKRLVLDDLFERVDESVPDQMGKYFNLSTLDTQTLQSLQSVKIEDIRDTILRDIVGDQYSEGAVAFEIESYELDQDDDDWFGTVFSAVIGIFQICIGIALLLNPASGPFLSSFAYGLISGGVSDIYNSVISVITGIPINLDNYLQSLGMRLAMNVITSCIAFAAHSLDLVHVKMWYGEGGVLETYKTMSSFIGTQFLYGAALVGIGTLMHNAGKNFLKKNMGEVEQEICAAIDALLRNRGQELRAIFASDSLEKGKRVEALFVSAYEISRNYYKRFGGVKKEVTNAVVSKVVHSAGILPALGASAALGAGMAINGYLNYKELIPDFVNAFDSAISSSAAGAIRSREIMNRKLRATFGTDTTTQLDAFLQRQGLFGEGQADFDYDHCEKFKEVDFLEFGDKKSAVMSACESVSKLMNSATASVRTAELGDKLKYIVLGNAKNMIMSEIVSPLSGVATGYFANYATDWIKEAHADSKMNDVKVEADKQQRKFEEKNKQYTTSQQKSGDTTDKSGGSGPEPIKRSVIQHRYVIVNILGYKIYHTALEIDGRFYEVVASGPEDNGTPLKFNLAEIPESTIFGAESHSHQTIGTTLKSDDELMRWTLKEYAPGKEYDFVSRQEWMVNCQDYTRDLALFATDGKLTNPLYMEDSPFGGGTDYRSNGTKF